MLRRSFAMFLCLVMVLSIMPVQAFAREDCEHHLEHDAACGYQEAVEGVPCGHVCGEGCPTKEVTACVHDHVASGCTYTEPKEAVYCGHTCGDGSCGYRAAVSGSHCTCGAQPHAEGCGYVEAQPEIPCDFIHNGCGCAEAVAGGWSCGHVCTGDSGCVKAVCAHTCPGDDCGFVASRNPSPCTYSCGVCQIQELIDALPEEVTLENMEAVGAQLTAIDEARAKLSDEELELVDFTRYQNAIAAINVLNGMPGAEEPVTLATSGSCGTSATWEISGSTLYIRGSGKMKNYTSSSPAPWREYKDTIRTISISSGITHIGNSAFDRFRAVTKITIPSSVTSIGNFAFRECSISSVSLGSNMTSLGTQAFAGCANLTSVTLPPRVALGGYCFIDCTSLTKVTIPAGVTCPGAVSTDFSGCSGLTEVTIAEGATNVYPWMFFECFGLKKVNLPSTLKTIGEGAFSSCTSLEEVTVPASVTVVDWEAFGGCTSLKKITFTGNAPDINYQAFTDVVAYGYYPYGNTTWTSSKLVDYNGDITWNAEGAPANPSGKCGDNAYWEFDPATGVLSITGSGNMYDYATLAAVPFDTYKTKITSVKVGEGITSIGDRAFQNAPVTSVILPSTLKDIGNQAFYGTKITSVNIPNTVTGIGDGAFEGTGLTGVKLPASLKVIGASAFKNTHITSVTVPASVTDIGEAAFAGEEGKSKLTAIVFEGAPPSIGAYTFAGVTATATCDAEKGWTSSHTKQYGGNLTWNVLNPCYNGHGYIFSIRKGSLIVGVACSRCQLEGKLTLVLPTSLVYTGSPIEATVTNTVEGLTTPTVTYSGPTTDGKPVEAGEYTASITLGGIPVSGSFRIVKTEYVAKTTVNGVTTSYESLEDAFTAANNASSAEVVLLKDIAGAPTGDADIQVTGNVVLNLAGFDITDKLIWVKSGGSLTVRDSGSQPGKVSQTGDYSSYLTNAGTLKLESGSITCGVDNTGTMTVSGGSVSGPGSAAIQNNGTLYVKGGSVSGLANGIINMGTLEVSGGTVTGATAITNPISGVTAVTGGSISGKNLDIDYGGTATGILQGGTFADGLSLRGISLQKALGQGKGYFVDGIYVKVTDTAATTLSGKVEVKAADESNYRIFIDREGYAQGFAALDDAFAAVQPGDTLRLTQDAVGEAELTKSGSFTLDLSGKAVAGDVTVGSGAELTVTGNGHLDATVLVKGSLKVPAGTDYSRVFGEAGAKLTVGTLEMTWDASVNRWVCGSHRWVFGEGTAKCSVCGLEEVLTITAQDATFSGEPLQPVVTVTLGSARLTEGTDFTLSYGNNINAGIGSVTVTGIGNCSGTAETAFTIQPLAIQVDIASIPDRPYSGEAVTPNVELVLEEGYDGPIPQLGSDYTLTYTDNMGPGTASVTVRACEGGNFTFRSVTQTYGIRHGVELPGVTGTVYVDGVPSQVEDGILWLDESGAKLITLYDHANAGAEDLHTVYPTAMYVYEVTGSAEQGYTARRVTELDNILQYSGTSIRITGNQGIRFITSIPNAKKSALTGSGLAGFTLVEYGTLMGWYDEGKELLYDVNVKSVAYSKASGTDAVFNRSGDLCQFTGMLTDLELEQSTRDLMTRPYMVLARTGADGQTEQVVLYGGSIVRSIGYVAYQNKDVFKPGTSSYEFIWKILSYAYPDLYEAEYKG